MKKIQHYSLGLRVSTDQLVALTGVPKPPQKSILDTMDVAPVKDGPSVMVPPSNASTAPLPASSAPQMPSAARPAAGSSFLQNIAKAARQGTSNEDAAATANAAPIALGSNFDVFVRRICAILPPPTDKKDYDKDRLAAEMSLAVERIARTSIRLSSAIGLDRPSALVDAVIEIHPEIGRGETSQIEAFEKTVDIATIVFSKLSPTAQSMFGTKDSTKFGQDPAAEFSLAVGRSMLKISDIVSEFSFQRDPKELAWQVADEIVESARDMAPEFLSGDCTNEQFAGFMATTIDVGVRVYEIVHKEWCRKALVQIERTRKTMTAMEYEKFREIGLNVEPLMTDFRERFLEFSNALRQRVANFDKMEFKTSRGFSP